MIYSISKQWFIIQKGESGLAEFKAFLKKARKIVRMVLRPIKKSLATVATALLCVFLVIVISVTIIGSAFTVYIVNLMEGTTEITLDNVSSSYSTYIYAQDSSGNWITYDILTSQGEKRIWCDLEKIPQFVQDAFVYSEDERFYNHDGVDFQGILAAVKDIVIKHNLRGASTITQQTIKNITGDNEDDGYAGIERKLREVYRAVQLEKNYTKDDILESYLNLVPLNNNIYGVQAAANYYFNKDVSELTIGEAACIAAITRNPYFNDPIKFPDKNFERRKYILEKMLENGAISTEQFDYALNEEMNLIGSMMYSKVDDETLDSSMLSAYDNFDDVSSYYIDSVINQCVDIFMDRYGITWQEAYEKLRSGGYSIYTCVDLDIQKELERKYLDLSTFTDKDEFPQSAFICMDYNGRVLGVVGGIGKKESPLGLNRATQSTRQPGSSIKPIASYSLAVDKDMITWSSQFLDCPLLFEDASAENGYMVWPVNYSTSSTRGNWSREYNFTYQCLQRSLNTTAAQIVEMLSPQACFDQLYYKLHIGTLALYQDGHTDVARSPMTVGALTNGVTLKDITTAYQIFGNGGRYYESTFISRILDNSGEVIYSHSFVGENVISEASAYVMNRMMETVVSSSRGTGRAAKLDGVELIAKTGTTNDWKDIWFLGCTPEYVTGLWVGYDIPADIGTDISSAKIWKNVFGDIAEAGSIKSFRPSSSVVTRDFCTVTGLVAGPDCTDTSIGYYKRTNIPGVCSGEHMAQDAAKDAVIVCDGVDTNHYEELTGKHYTYVFDILRDGSY